MCIKAQSRRKLIEFCLAILTSIGFVCFGPTNPAHADPGCVNGGVYVLFARGSGEHLNDLRASSFRSYVVTALAQKGISTAWDELGNEDGSVDTSRPNSHPDASNEYPAVSVNNWHVLPWIYGDSVNKGTNELIKHLNQRYSNGPGGRNCTNETVLIGGYSQGADVVGWALQRSGWGSLSLSAKSHIGYVALYGDPKFDPGPLADRQNHVNFATNWWWVRGNDPGFRYESHWPYPDRVLRDSGILGPRNAYVPREFKGRFGSWCAYYDGICTGRWPSGMSVHNHDYQGGNGWIANSVSEIASQAIAKRNALNPASI